MKRAGTWLSALTVVLAQLACKGQEVAVFEMPGGSGGQAGGGQAGGGAPSAGAGSPATAGDTSAGGVAGSMDVVPPGGSGGMAGGGAGGMAGSGGMPLGMPCMHDPDCGLGWLCEKAGCDAPTGVCEPRPVFLPPEPDPVCGCDGITYWNDSIRRAYGATLDTLGECRASACSCEVGADCEVPGASCSHLVAPGEMCGHGTGACWVLPPQCVPTGDPMVWQACRPPDATDPPPPCVDTCLAIRSEKPHAPPHHGDCN
jgi:hypothetical protein